VFEQFEQADRSTTRKYGGTGLGLAIAARLAEKMEGTITVKSKVGRGSTFEVDLPLERVSDEFEPAPPIDHQSVKGLRVLICDDNATNRHILESNLRQWGMKPASCAGGVEALDLLRTSAGTKRRFRLLISDVNMPEMDGFSLVQHVREDASLEKLPIILLTSGVRSDDAARCRELKVQAHLTKPARQSEMLNAILGALPSDDEPASAEQVPTSEMPQTRPLNILLVEDSLPNQKLAIGLLRRWGHEVTTADDGVEGLEVWADGNFDLVLMDVEMPEMDGLQATVAIREREQSTGGHVPIIAMTAHAMTGDRERCLAAGMDAYIAKPIRQREFAAVMEDLFPSE
jgi:CheY-like chemotaxis protein